MQKKFYAIYKYCGKVVPFQRVYYYANIDNALAAGEKFLLEEWEKNPSFDYEQKVKEWRTEPFIFGYLNLITYDFEDVEEEKREDFNE